MMRRNMQNLSFLAIIAALLSCAFFFSQQTKANLQAPLPQASQTADAEPKSIEDVPDCTGLGTVEESLTCYSRAALIAQQLLDSKTDAILKLETDPQRRMDFIEIQLAWEESRDKDCAYIKALSGSGEQSALNEAICLTDHNLDRYEQLTSYYCEWVDPSACENEN